MTEFWYKNNIYRTAVSPKKRQELGAAYREYVSLVSHLKEWIEEYTVKDIAQFSIDNFYKGEILPWNMEPASEQETQAYSDFVNDIDGSAATDNCFISTRRTTAEATEDKTIMSAPVSYKVWTVNNPLPHRIERFLMAYPEQQTLRTARFIVDGKHVLKYCGQTENLDKPLAELTASENFEKKICCMLDILTLLPDKKEKLSIEEQLKLGKKAHIEAFSSAATAPLESIILDALTLVTEESNKILKILVGKRIQSGYFAQAEKEGLIKSAKIFQDYLNIRQLVHHQWDTLDNISKFNVNESVKNASLRRRYLDSYNSLCNKSLKERANAYIEAAAIFTPLVSILNDDLLIREPNESHNKFCKRVCDAVAANPDKEIYIQTGYMKQERRGPLIKKLEKISPSVKIIDKIEPNNNMLELQTIINGYLQRRHFLDLFHHIEYKICQYCLFSGKNYTTNIAWDYCRRQHLVNPKEAEQWAEYKKIRNDLSHQYMNEEINTNLSEVMDGFEDTVGKLSTAIEERMPEVRLLDGNIYRAVHKNGMTVDIDFAEKKVLRIIHSSGKIWHPAYNTTNVSAKAHQYTEEYENGTSITVAGPQILSCRLNNGITVDMEKHKISFADDVTIYRNQDGHYTLSAKGGEKIFMDKFFKVITFINRGKESTYAKNIRYSINPYRKIFLGPDMRLNSDTWSVAQHKMTTDYIKNDNGVTLQFSDGTKIEINDQNIEVFHRDIPLSYQTRKQFADSYTSPSAATLLLNNSKKRD